MKKTFVFTFVMTIVGAIIGAGFASGREIVSFFATHGYWALIFLPFVFGLFFFFFYVFSKLGKMIKPKSISDMTNAMFGKAGVFVDFAFILSTFITLSSMLAGSDSIGQIVFGSGYNFCYISILTAMIVAVIVSVGLKYIYKVTDLILPVMLILITAVIIIFLTSNEGGQVSPSNISSNFASATLSTILYASMNTFANIFIIAKTSQFMSKKQIGMASGISSGVLSVFITLILIIVLRGGNSIFLSDMPMLQVAYGISNFFGVVYAIVLWLAIFTTICIAAYTIVEWLNRFIKNKFLCSVITITLGFIFSRFGFSTIVGVFYPIEGVFGGIFIVYSIVYYFKNRKKYQRYEIMEIAESKVEQSAEILNKDFEKSIQTDDKNLKSIEIKKKNGDVKVKKKYFKKEDK